MAKDKHITEMIFRVDTTPDFKGTVFALFPHEVCNFNGNVTYYQHIGQHGEADYNHCIATSRPATAEEYKDLKTELDNIGYNIVIRSKRNYAKYLKSYYKVRGIK